MGFSRLLVGLTLSGAWLSGVAFAQEPEPKTEEEPAEEVDSDADSEEPELSPEEQAAEFKRELRTVEEDVSSLKERVFRSKATLKLLKELVVDTAAGGAQLVVWHVNELGSGYTMESAQYYLDGKSIYSKVDPGGSLDEMREQKVHERSLPAGEHDLQVNYVLKGKGKLFSYLNTYQFRVQSSHAFRVDEGQLTVMRVIAEGKGGLRNFVDRPTVAYDLRSATTQEE